MTDQTTEPDAAQMPEMLAEGRIWYNSPNPNECGSGALTPSRVVTRHRRSGDVKSVSPSKSIRKLSGFKQCKDCLQTLPYDAFDHQYSPRGINRGRFPVCRACLAQYGVSAFSSRQERTAARRIRRFWAHVHKTETCWIWTGRRDRGGYGSLQGERDGRFAHVKAHRFSYGIYGGSTRTPRPSRRIAH